LKANDLAEFNASLQQAKLPPVTIAEFEMDSEDMADGGRASALVEGLVGTHFYGDWAKLEERGEKD
jgi:hypothetical protein